MAAALSSRRLGYLRRLDVSQNLLTYEALQDIVAALQAGGGAQLRMLKLGSTGAEFVEVNEMARLWKQKLKVDGNCPHLAPGDEEDAAGAPVPAPAGAVGGH